MKYKITVECVLSQCFPSVTLFSQLHVIIIYTSILHSVFGSATLEVK